jgi:DNA polymerase/3'-5' exonuclease PolX
MSDKTKWPIEVARVVADGLGLALAPYCEPERCVIAGSMRRQKPEVGDIELVYVPRKVVGMGDLFEPASLVDEVLARMLEERVIAKRLNVKGSEMWGASNKLGVHVPSGIPVDFFATTEASFWNYLVCRTGGAENNVALASAAKRRGWQWNPYGEGFSRPRGLGPPEIAPMHSEREVFAFARLPWLEPEERR